MSARSGRRRVGRLRGSVVPPYTGPDQAGVEAFADGDAVPAGPGLLIGDVVAVDRPGAGRWATHDLRDDFRSFLSLCTSSRS